MLETRSVSEADALTRGLAAKSAEFNAAGGAFYVPVDTLTRKA